jgi:serine/threonine-protein kinase PRP4
MFEEDDERWEDMDTRAGMRISGRGAGAQSPGDGEGAFASSSSSSAAAGLDGGADAEGYYKMRVGEYLLDRYQVLGTRGRGVFSSVLYCRDGKAAMNANAGDVDDESTLADLEACGGELRTIAAPMAVGSTGALVRQHAALATGSSAFVAVKLVRANDTMRRAAAKEVEVLRTLATADPGGKYHCVRLLHTFEHQGHPCLVFEPLSMNLKEVQTKFGSGVGIAVAAVRSYARQLLLALGLLAKLHVIHADIKPHNILASEGFATVKLADFGSAFREDDPDNEPTPLLVSRFYRSPEIILLHKPTPALDMWSAACVLFELYSGQPLFPGASNNDMLYRVQRLRGRFPPKMVRRYNGWMQAHGGPQQAAAAGELHFDEDLRFLRHVTDPVTREPGVKAMEFTGPAEDLTGRVMAARAEGDDKRAVSDLASLLDRMLAVDPAKRISVKEALAHPFIKYSGVKGGGGGGGGR